MVLISIRSATATFYMGALVTSECFCYFYFLVYPAHVFINHTASSLHIRMPLCIVPYLKVTPSSFTDFCSLVNTLHRVPSLPGFMTEGISSKTSCTS